MSEFAHSTTHSTTHSTIPKALTALAVVSVLTSIDPQVTLDRVTRFLSKVPVREHEDEFHKFISENKDVLVKIMSNFEIDGELVTEEHIASFFCDYYKWSMFPAFSTVYERLLDKDTKPIMAFSVDFRDQPVRERLASNPELQELIIRELTKFSRRTFNINMFKALIEKKYAQSQDDTRVPPVSQLSMYSDCCEFICFDNEGNPRTIANTKICLEKYIPGVTPGYNIDDVVISCYTHSGQFYVEATGPWPLVTWLETSMMQNVYQTIANYMRSQAGMSYDDWLYNAMFRCFLSCKQITELNQSKPSDRPRDLNGALFTGRRTGSMEFLVIQNWMVKVLYKSNIGTSSVDAWWLLKKWGICEGPEELNPVGTHAHELSMGLAAIVQAINPELDSVMPLSQILGHYLYYKYCNVRQGKSMKIPMLPDTLGTPAFLAAAFSIIMRGTETKKNFLEECIGSARQDSGTLEGFVEFLDRYNYKVPCMASEISLSKDIKTAIDLMSPLDGRFPYALFGAGGYFGDSPKPHGHDEFYQSMAVKIVRCFLINTAGGKTIQTHPVKLGDSEPGKVGKVSIDGTLDSGLQEVIKRTSIAMKDYWYDKRPESIDPAIIEKANKDFWVFVDFMGF